MFWSHDVPFKPGASPFRCKGVLYLDTLAYFDERLPGGRRALLAHMEDDQLREFLSQHFVVGGWYDVFPLAAIHSAAARFSGMPYLELVREVARWQLPRQFRGLYKFLLKLSSPELVMTNLPRLGEKYYDFVRIEVRPLRPKTYESLTGGVPEAVASAYMICSDVAIREALELCGAQGIRIRWFPIEPDGEAHSRPCPGTAPRGC